MMTFKSTAMTKQVAQTIGVLYIIYAFFMMKASTLLFSLAVGLIVLGLMNSMEIAVAATIITGLLVRVVFKSFDGFQTIDPVDVEKRLAAMRAAAPAGMPNSSVDIPGNPADYGFPVSAAKAQPVLASDFAEGFSNATDASSEATGDSSASGSAKAPASAPAPVPSGSGSATQPSSGFAGQVTTDGLFRLGGVPSDAPGGPHLDAGSTIMNAMQALKPDQIKSMTDDTRKLLDTQKSLMGMLETMKPMLTDGAQLLNTFGGMFGGAAPGAMQFGGQGGQQALSMLGGLGATK
jgi:hypothetical protein